MSNDPNRLVNQQRQRHENRVHSTLETVKIEEGSAALPKWQQTIIYGLAIVGAGAIVVLALLALGVIG